MFAVNEHATSPSRADNVKPAGSVPPVHESESIPHTAGPPGHTDGHRQRRLSTPLPALTVAIPSRSLLSTRNRVVVVKGQLVGGKPEQATPPPVSVAELLAENAERASHSPACPPPQPRQLNHRLVQSDGRSPTCAAKAALAPVPAGGGPHCAPRLHRRLPNRRPRQTSYMPART